MSSQTVTPEVLWAQRSHENDADKNIIYLTINAPDCAPDSVEAGVGADKVHFSGSSKLKNYVVDMELYAEVDPALSRTHISPRGVDFVLRKKELKSKFWPRLLKDDKKQHYLKTDFDKWVDEDEQEEPETSLGEGGGGAQFGGGDGAGGFGDIDFSKIAGMGDMGDMGGMGGMDMSSLQGMGAGAPGGEDNDEDEDEMPELEDGKPPAPTEQPKVSAGIEEIGE